MISILGGLVGLVMGRGRSESGQLRKLSTCATGAILPWAPSNRVTRLISIASRLNIKHGISTCKIIVINTSHATITGYGTIDLARRHMAKTIIKRAKEFTLMSLMAPNRVSAPISDPNAFPDPSRIATRTNWVIAGLAGTVYSAIGFRDSPRDGHKAYADVVSRAESGSRERGAKSKLSAWQRLPAARISISLADCSRETPWPKDSIKR